MFVVNVPLASAQCNQYLQLTLLQRQYKSGQAEFKTENKQHYPLQLLWSVLIKGDCMTATHTLGTRAHSKGGRRFGLVRTQHKLRTHSFCRSIGCFIIVCIYVILLVSQQRQTKSGLNRSTIHRKLIKILLVHQDNPFIICEKPHLKRKKKKVERSYARTAVCVTSY